MILAIYFIVGLIWTFSIDKFTASSLGLPAMSTKEIAIQILLWPVGMLIFAFTFIREIFLKKN